MPKFLKESSSLMGRSANSVEIIENGLHALPYTLQYKTKPHTKTQTNNIQSEQPEY